MTLVNSSVNVFLGSQGLGALSCWLEELVRRPKLAALVPTAANPLPDAPWVQQVATRLKACGVSVEQLDLQDATRPTVATVLAGVDLVFVTGGYPIFLLEQAQRTGFIDLVREDARQGRLAYAGMSAGASLAGPDLALYRAPDDPGAVTSTAGLALSPFFPLTHANRGRQEWFSSIIAANPESRFVTITDEQAVVIAGDAWDLRWSPIIDE